MSFKPHHILNVKFICKICGSTFRRNLHRIYIDAPTLDRIIKKEPSSYSEFIIPTPIECSKCKSVNQSELSLYNQSMLRISAILRGRITKYSPKDPLQVVTFKFEGKVMHPLEALEHYQHKIGKKSDDLPSRLLFAYILRTIGRRDEAEAQYRIVIKQDASDIEAWYNLAAISAARKHKRLAKEALQNLISNAIIRNDPDREILMSNAQGMLDGIIPMEVLSLDLLLTNLPSKRSKMSHKK